jgi:hypothetical protein
MTEEKAGLMKLFLACVILFCLFVIVVCFMADVSRTESVLMSLPFFLSIFASVELMLRICFRGKKKGKAGLMFYVLSVACIVLSICFADFGHNIVPIVFIVVIRIVVDRRAGFWGER